MKYAVRANFGITNEIGVFISRSRDYETHQKLIIRTPRGTEIGTFVRMDKELEQGEKIETDGKVIGSASDEELRRMDTISSHKQPEEMRYCKEKIKDRGLKMNLRYVEHIFGGERMIFYFTADKRVDFRELVKDLAKKYKTRIEMKQIGARDEAALLGKCGICGQSLCCRMFTDKIKPVSMRKAKIQTSTLDPAKVSGRCGRLKCCFRYEYETYRDLKKELPEVGDYIKTRELQGEVVELAILMQKITVIPDKSRERCEIDANEVIEIIRR